jgi:hypothetical protein
MHTSSSDLNRESISQNIHDENELKRNLNESMKNSGDLVH